VQEKKYAGKLNIGIFGLIIDYPQGYLAAGILFYSRPDVSTPLNMTTPCKGQF
jgi:hypothetical protein